MIKKIIDNKYMYIAITLIIYIIVFVIIGENSVLLWKDSPAYLSFDKKVGVMPIYPLVLYINKLIFGERLFLYFVVAEQTVFTMICLFSFTEFIRKKFKLSYVATYPVIILSIFMPFTVNYPLSISNHDIMTEALAYPYFYIYMICFLKVIFDKKYKAFVLLIFVSIGLPLIRTQLQLICVFNAMALFYIIWMSGRKYSLVRQLIRVIGIVISCMVIIIITEGLVLGANSIGQKMIAALNRVSDISVNEKDILEENDTDLSNMTEQYGHLIIDKAIYEIDEGDYLLFDDAEMRKLCQAIYEVAEADKLRYVHARGDLWIWKDIMDGIASGTSIAGKGWTIYYQDNPDTYLNYNAVNQIARELLKEHFGRVIYHTLCMLPQGFICTVFFQKESFYMLCHIITLIIYLSALGLVIWVYSVKKIPNRYGEFLLACIVINVSFVIILSTVFFAMQRYLIYCFGIFYVSYYLVLLRLFEYWREKRRISKHER